MEAFVVVGFLHSLSDSQFLTIDYVTALTYVKT